MGYFEPNCFKIHRVTLTSTAQVNAGTDVTAQLQPSVGRCYKIIDIYGSWPDPVGSTAGTHTVEIGYNGQTGYIIYLSAGTGNNITIDQNYMTASGTERPSSNGDQFLVVHDLLYASNTYPLDIKYSNSTDANQTGSRKLEFIVKEYIELI